MNEVLLVPACYVRYVIWMVALFSFVLGVLSAFWPSRSIGLYVWMMFKFSWTVSPMNERREIKNTRRFGIYLLILSVLMFLTLYWGMFV